ESGRRFVLDEALFFRDPVAIWEVEEDVTFDVKREFDSKVNFIQGQLRYLLAMLPSDARPLRKERWIMGAFLDGMDNQRSFFSHRLRGPSLPNIVEDTTPFTTSRSRFDAFAGLIGHQPANDSSEAFYSPFKAEILYDVYNGSLNVDHIFKGPVLLKIHASLIRGPNGARGLFEGRSKRPQAKCIEKIYHIMRTLPGAIANAAALAIWLYSPDTQLVECGDETGIDYRKRYVQYVTQIRKGLRQEKEWATNLLKHWDGILFPHSEDTLAPSLTANAKAEEDKINKAQDAFENAPTASVVCHLSALCFNSLSDILPLF
ncbi:hypothetical protein DFH08DRAFT_701960, partial [Mycena albidolilacea]